MPYQAIDFYDYDALLTEEERLVRDTVRSYVTDRIMPSIAHHWEAGTFPDEIIPELGKLGLLGPTNPIHENPLSYVGYGIAMRELERGDSGIRSFASVQGSLVMFPIGAYGSEEQKKRWLKRLAAGEAIGCFGLTEPDAGSNPAGMRTSAKFDDGGYTINGAKRWITNGTKADVAVVWAKVQGGPDDGEVRGFLLERGMVGFQQLKMHHKLSMRASDTAELVFENVKVGPEAMLPGVRGMKGPLSCLTQARFGISFGVIGAAQACFDEAVNYAKTRVQFSGPIAKHQLVQEKIAIMLTDITKAQAIAIQLGRMFEQKRAQPAHISLAKRNNVEAALEVARTCRALLGGNGITGEYQAMRHMCNLETVYTYEGTHDIHTLVLGQAMTGIAAYD
jgi:glutaryl-CoA dehydrogenase